MTSNALKPADELKQTDVPAQVFEDFLTALPVAEISEDVISRLRQLLLTDKKFTEHALRSAVFGEEV